jgi:hypothetical protein
MSLETELRRLFGRIEDAPWPGEREAFDRFLHRKMRRGRVMAAGLAMALAASVGAAVLVPRVLPKHVEPVVPVLPRGATVPFGDAGFETPVPTGWTISRLLTGQPSLGYPGPGRASVVGVVFAPRSGTPQGATITVTTDDHDTNLSGAQRRPDGRFYVLRTGDNRRSVGQYAIQWPSFCRKTDFRTCTQVQRPRVLLVTGSTSGSVGGARDQVLQAMREILAGVQPITSALRPPPTPTLSPGTKVMLGKGGSERTAWEVSIEPMDRRITARSKMQDQPGFVIRYPWQEKRHPGQGLRWAVIPLQFVQWAGTYTLIDCLRWTPSSSRLLASGIAREDVATVRIELSGQAPLEVPTFGHDKPVPMVAFVSPPLPVGSRITRLVAFDAAGRMLGSEERGLERPCRRPAP